MASRVLGETTAPSQNSTFGSESQGPSVLAWLFPRTDGPVLELAPSRGESVIGRDDDCTVVLSGSDVSRRHARLKPEGHRLVLQDLDSRNGTFVAGLRIADKRSSLEPPLLRVGRSLLWAVSDVRPFRAGVTVEQSGVVLGGLLRRAWAEIELLGRSGRTLCLRGESGSGKELAARAFHELHGPSAAAPFIGVNCAAIPEGLAERLLFGARKGAFSGATGDVQGYIKAADGGTLFLDEVAELDLRVQAKLLRVLETREVLPLGATRPERVDLRVCVASHADLAEQVAAGKFREDLYYRLGRPVVAIPPIRERLDELAWLIQGEIGTAGSHLSASVRLVEACATRPWPGNVRELIGEVRRQVAGLAGLELPADEEALP